MSVPTEEAIKEQQQIASEITKGIVSLLSIPGAKVLRCNLIVKTEAGSILELSYPATSIGNTRDARSVVFKDDRSDAERQCP